MAESTVNFIKRPKSLTALVVDQVREMIITEQFALGELLSENNISEMLGVSRGPVRDAFIRLQVEGLVNVQPQRGTFVFQYTLNELREICELREVLETGALRIAMNRRRETLVRILQEKIEAAEVEGGCDPRSYQVFDAAFHEGLVSTSENNELMEAYHRISGRIRAVRHRLTRSRQHVINSQNVHKSLLTAIAAGRDAEAVATLADHVYTNYQRLVASSRSGRHGELLPDTDAPPQEPRDE